MSQSKCPKYEGCIVRRTLEKYLELAKMPSFRAFNIEKEFEEIFCKGGYESCPAYE